MGETMRDVGVCGRQDEEKGQKNKKKKKEGEERLRFGIRKECRKYVFPCGWHTNLLSHARFPGEPQGGHA